MKWILIVLAILIAFIAFIALIGLMVPKGHTASRTIQFKKPVEEVWKTISELGTLATWRKDLKGIERLPEVNGHAVWREEGKFGKITYELVELDAPRRMKTRIADPDLPYSGSWTYVVAPVEGGSTLTITEDGEVKNPIFRFMARFVFGYTATMEQVLRSLATHFGEEVRFVG